MLITEAYRELNRQLHESREDYGVGSSRWTEAVLAVRTETESKSVLDYGCGKGLLRKALGYPKWFKEYDPAIKGKDKKPRKADLVVCADVLEHIEPECLEDVLEHLRKLAFKVVFFCIATRPAKKTLADGRNAHLIVEDQAWWRAKLETRFRIREWFVEPGQITGTMQPYFKLGELKVKGALPDSVRFEHAKINIPKVKDRLEIKPRHDRRAIIVCFGPSLAATWGGVKMERLVTGAAVVTVSGAHEYLISREIVPDYHVEVDPREHKAFFTRNPHPEVNYWLASCVHPKMIKQLEGHKVSLWHVLNGEDSFRLINELEPDGMLISGGGSAGCRAVNVLFTQGYRTFSIHGMDCSFSPDGKQHPAAHSGKAHIETNVKCGDRWFRTSGTWIAIARGFIQNMHLLEGAARANDEPALNESGDRVQFFMHGDGFLQHMCRIGMTTPSKEAA